MFVITCFTVIYCRALHDTLLKTFLASRDKYVRGANVIVLPSASASVVWTKTLTLAITFKPEVIGLSYCTCVFLVTRPFTWYHNFWPCDLNLEVWPTLKNFNLGCYLLMVAAWQTSLSSDNSYYLVPYSNLDLQLTSRAYFSVKFLASMEVLKSLNLNIVH